MFVLLTKCKPKYIYFTVTCDTEMLKISTFTKMQRADFWLFSLRKMAEMRQ